MKFNKIVKKTLMILLILLIAGILLVPRKNTTEGFQVLTGKTSETIYRDTKDYKAYDKKVADPTFMNSIDDSESELIMSRCYQWPDVRIEQFTRWMNDSIKDPKTVGTRGFTVMTYNFTDVKNKIIEDIERVKDTLIKDPINGPVYALITQVPYYKDAQGKDIVIQSFNVDGYNYQPTYTSDPKNMNGNQPIYYLVWMFYGQYKNKQWTMTRTDGFKQIMQILDQSGGGSGGLGGGGVSYEQQCYMAGAGSGGAFNYAGCSSSDGKINGVNSASCLGPKAGNNILQTDKLDPKTTKSSYAILYTINPKATSIAPFFNNHPLVIPELTEDAQYSIPDSIPGMF
jgi:hypothetical protein